MFNEKLKKENQELKDKIEGLEEKLKPVKKDNWCIEIKLKDQISTSEMTQTANDLTPKKAVKLFKDVFKQINSTRKAVLMRNVLINKSEIAYVTLKKMGD